MAELLDSKTPVITGVKPNAGDITLGLELYRQAYAAGMSLSAFLEKEDPSEPHKDGLDAFERQMKLAGIRTKSDPRLGVFADKVDAFWTGDQDRKWLLPEFMFRVYRAVGRGGYSPEIKQRFYASSEPVSDVLYPSFIQGAARQKQIAPAVPLSELVAMTTPISNETYKAFYLTDDSDERTMKRVGEGAQVPTAKLTGGDHDIHLYKYGRRLLGSYEVFRRMRIDRFALHIALLAVQAEVDKVDTALDVIVNGDGNANTAATNSNLTALDIAAAAGTLTLKGYLAWRLLWTNPYECNVILAQSASGLQLILLNLGSANVPFYQMVGNFGVGGITLINSTMGAIRLGLLANAPTLKLVGIDNRFALEMVLEIGGTITETDKVISTQMNEIVFTEILGFAVLDANGNRTLDINA